MTSYQCLYIYLISIPVCFSILLSVYKYDEMQFTVHSLLGSIVCSILPILNDVVSVYGVIYFTYSLWESQRVREFLDKPLLDFRQSRSNSRLM